MRRTYYLLQMPGWGRRLRIMIDWTFALLFRPDIVKISLDSEVALLLGQLKDEEAADHGYTVPARTASHDEAGGFSGAQLRVDHDTSTVST